MYSNINAKAFTYVSGSNTAISVTSTTRVFSSPVDNYAEEVFPIISKTNTNFTYYHPNLSYTTATITGTASTGNVTITASNTTGLYIGQPVARVAGASMADTFVNTVINATAFTVVTAPTSSGAITLVVSGESPQTLTETPGKIVKNSDGTMRVYFKSGWIG